MKREGSLLLSFSNHLATVRDLNGLQWIIKQFLKQIFQISEYIITLRNADNKTYSYFLHDCSGEDPKDEGFRIITGEKMPISGSMTGAVLRREEPSVFCIKEVVRSGRYSFPSASFWKAAGAENIMGIRLRVGQEDVGILWLQAYQTNDQLLKGISAQIAIAIAHALAQQEIELQSRELNRYRRQGVGGHTGVNQTDGGHMGGHTGVTGVNQTDSGHMGGHSGVTGVSHTGGGHTGVTGISHTGISHTGVSHTGGRDRLAECFGGIKLLSGGIIGN